MNSTHTFTRVDVTSTDPHEIARLWGVEVGVLPGGLLALPVREHCIAMQPFDTEKGEPGDILLVNNQKMQRHIISAALFDFLFGKRL